VTFCHRKIIEVFGEAAMLARVKTKSRQLQGERGRPPKPDKARTVRVSPRIPESLAKRIEQAAAWRGMTMASFIVDAARKQAEEIIEREERWQLNAQKAETMAKILSEPCRPTEFAEEAACLAASHVEIHP
jgi:uncharacterized protein (DUF1778 family)